MVNADVLSGEFIRITSGSWHREGSSNHGKSIVCCPFMPVTLLLFFAAVNDRGRKKSLVTVAVPGRAIVIPVIPKADDTDDFFGAGSG